jgi:hypothetical protein
MAITLADIQTNLNTYLGDASTDRISAAERYQAITEATTWLQEETQNDHTIDTYDLNYFDTVNEYKVTTSIADLLEGADLRREPQLQFESFTRKSSRELAEEIGQAFGESSFAIERRDRNAYLVVNHASRYTARVISSFESTEDGGGTWAVDATNSDATNLTEDATWSTDGAGCLNYDLTVAQSGNNRGTVQNSTLDELDLSDDENLSSFILDVYIPDVTYVTGYTMYWGSSTTAYWSLTSTTDINGNALVTGKNTIKFTWSSATKTLTPDVEAIDFIRIDVNYSASQANATDFRIDRLRLVRPEILKFYYTSWAVGEVSAADSTEILAFTATTNVPYFSGQYDQYKYAVAHKAASILFTSPLRLNNQSLAEEKLAVQQLQRVKKLIPVSKTPEMKSFKVRGISFRRRSR